MRVVLFALFSQVLVLAPAVAFGAETGFFGPIVPECAYTTGSICRACDLVELLNNLLQFIISFAVVVATVMFAYAGFLYVSASTNAKNVDSARKIFSGVFIGLVLILGAWLIVDLVLRTLTPYRLSVLTDIECINYSEPLKVSPIDPSVQGEIDDIIGDDPFLDSEDLLSDTEARAYAEQLGLEVSDSVSTMEGTARQTLDTR